MPSKHRGRDLSLLSGCDNYSATRTGLYPVDLYRSDLVRYQSGYKHHSFAAHPMDGVMGGEVSHKTATPLPEDHASDTSFVEQTYP